MACQPSSNCGLYVADSSPRVGAVWFILEFLVSDGCCHSLFCHRRGQWQEPRRCSVILVKNTSFCQTVQIAVKEHLSLPDVAAFLLTSRPCEHAHISSLPSVPELQMHWLLWVLPHQILSTEGTLHTLSPLRTISGGLPPHLYNPTQSSDFKAGSCS